MTATEWVCIECEDGRCEDCLTPWCDHDCQGLDDIDDGPDVVTIELPGVSW
ncbi:MAG TPA: hypothetical protein VIQ30_10265 [Pseudonocardia sp.]